MDLTGSFFSNEVLGLLNKIFQQKEVVFCSDVNMSELTCPKLVFWQGGEVLSNCYLKIPFLMFPWINFGSHDLVQETFSKIMQLEFSLN